MKLNKTYDIKFDLTHRNVKKLLPGEKHRNYLVKHYVSY